MCFRYSPEAESLREEQGELEVRRRVRAELLLATQLALPAAKRKAKSAKSPAEVTTAAGQGPQEPAERKISGQKEGSLKGVTAHLKPVEKGSCVLAVFAHDFVKHTVLLMCILCVQCPDMGVVITTVQPTWSPCQLAEPTQPKAQTKSCRRQRRPKTTARTGDHRQRS